MEADNKRGLLLVGFERPTIYQLIQDRTHYRVASIRPLFDKIYSNRDIWNRTFSWRWDLKQGCCDFEATTVPHNHRQSCDLFCNIFEASAVFEPAYLRLRGTCAYLNVPQFLTIVSSFSISFYVLHSVRLDKNEEEEVLVSTSLPCLEQGDQPR